MDKQKYDRIKKAIQEAKETALLEGRNIASPWFEDVLTQIFEDEGVTQSEFQDPTNRNSLVDQTLSELADIQFKHWYQSNKL